MTIKKSQEIFINVNKTNIYKTQNQRLRIYIRKKYEEMEKLINMIERNKKNNQVTIRRNGKNNKRWEREK